MKLRIPSGALAPPPKATEATAATPAARTLTLLPREDLPSCHDNIIQDLKSQDYHCVSSCALDVGVGGAPTLRLVVGGFGKDFVYHKPCIGIFFELGANIVSYMDVISWTRRHGKGHTWLSAAWAAFCY